MSRYSIVSLLACAVALCHQAYGAIVVEERSGYERDVYYTVHGDSDITILQPIDWRGPYQFECYDDSTAPPYEPAVIESITAGPGVGSVEVKVTGYGGRTYGASEVWLVQIGQTAGTGRLVELKISGNYGHAEQGGTLIADSAGALKIGGDVVKPVAIAGNVAQLYVPGCIYANMDVGGDVGRLEIGTVDAEAEITVGGDVGAAMSTYIGSLNGRLMIEGDVIRSFDIGSLLGCCSVRKVREFTARELSVSTLGGTLVVAEDVERDVLIQDFRPRGVIDIGGDLSGALTFAPYMCGELRVGGSVSGDIEVAESELVGRIVIAGNLGSSIYTGWDLTGRIQIGGDLAGAIEVGGDLTGTIEVGSPYADLDRMAGAILVPNGTLSGRILLNNGLAQAADVHFGEIGPDALFVVNNDGANPAEDDWEVGAEVRVGTAEPFQDVTGPDDESFWVASCLKGDANNSGAVNAFDIDPFVLLLTNPAGYCAAYPGLCGEGNDSEEGSSRGSYVYRGDLNCDGLVNAFDIDAFVLKLTDAEAWELAYPPSCVLEDNGECCPGDMLLAMGSRGAESAGAELESESAAATAALIVEYVSPELRPGLLWLATQLADELPDRQRAALWAEVEAELLGG